MTMPTPQETMTNAAYRGQEAFTWHQKIWEAKLHDVDKYVDKTFDFYCHVLEWEREFIKNWLSIISWADHKAVHLAREAVKEATSVRGSYDGVKDVAAKK